MERRSLAVASSPVLVQLAMSPAPTSVTGVVAPRTGIATTTAATHASTTHAAYLAAWLRISAALNPVLSTFEGAIFPSPYPAHGLSLVGNYYVRMLTTCFDVARWLPLSHNPERVFVDSLFRCNKCTILLIQG